MYSIGTLSKRTGVKVPTIRYYEQVGLLSEPDRTAGNQRRYGQTEIERLGFIRHARDLGFPIEAISSLISLNDHPDRSCADANAGRKARYGSKWLEAVPEPRSFGYHCLDKSTFGSAH
jgi:DNA-binding transcriptional MerR regulator